MRIAIYICADAHNLYLGKNVALKGATFSPTRYIRRHAERMSDDNCKTVQRDVQSISENAA